jgi:hypothetical protein
MQSVGNCAVLKDCPNKRSLIWLCFLVHLVAFPGRSLCQVRQALLVLINLNAHQPVPNQHLLFYAGRTPRQVRQHLALMKLLTDAQGRTSVELQTSARWFQVWIDGVSVCSKAPDRKMVFHSPVLFDEGIIV